MVRKIIKREGMVLNQSSEDVHDLPRVRAIVQDLWDTLDNAKKHYDFSRGCGIAAPQIGELLRISVVEYKDSRYTLINPKIVKHSTETIRIREGCLSFFQYRGEVERYEKLEVTAIDEGGKSFTITASEDNLSSLLQHEIDHLDGILYPQRLIHGEKLEFVPEKPELA